MDNRLPRSRRNQVFLLLQANGLDLYISDFKWKAQTSDTLDGSVSRLVFDDGGQEYYFLFDGDGDDYEVVYFPDANLGHVEGESATWRQAVEHVAIWAKAVAGELMVPDYWESPAEVATKVFGAAYSSGSQEQKFSADELEHIRSAALEYRRQLAATYQLSEAQQNEIDRKLEYLIQEAEAQSRQAWFHTAIGIIVAIAATIRPEAGVLAAAIALFGSVFAFSKRGLLR